MTKPPALSEKQLVDRLRPRYEGDSGNGPGGCVVAQVRDAAGFDAGRTIDALGFHFWPSRGLLIDAFECKSSRSDWQRELAAPDKAERFCQLADRFYVVAGRADIVKVDEVPPDWGLLVPSGEKLCEVKPAVVLHANTPAIEEWAGRMADGRRAAGPRPLLPGFDRSFLIAIIRQAYKITRITPQEIQEAERKGFEAGEQHKRNLSANYHELYEELHRTVREFEQGLGCSIKGFSYSGADAKTVGAALRAIVEGDHQAAGLRNRLANIGAQAQRLADEVAQQVAAIDGSYILASVRRASALRISPTWARRCTRTRLSRMWRTSHGRMAGMSTIGA